MQRLVIDPQQIQKNRVIFTTEQHHYLYRVLRLGTGDRVAVMDGEGNVWVACLQGKDAELQEPLLSTTELPLAVTLIVALLKGNSFETVVRGCTELGATCFVPALSDRALLNPSSNKLERWRRIAREAAEQSERQRVPKIVEPLRFPAQNLVGDLANVRHRYICVARKDVSPLLSALLARDEREGGIAIATGPEGGWTEAEVTRAIAHGFQPVSLGQRILKAITAPLVALTLVAAVVEGEH